MKILGVVIVLTLGYVACSVIATYHACCRTSIFMGYLIHVQKKNPGETIGLIFSRENKYFYLSILLTKLIARKGLIKPVDKDFFADMS